MYEAIITFFETIGFENAEAIKEAESVIRYHTTGIDAVSRDYAIEMIYNDLYE